MNKPHKHAALIKAWADGAEIQYKEVGYFADDSEWMDVKTPTWNTHIQYRIKPKIIKYRNFIWKPLAMSCPKRVVVSICSYEENLQEPRDSWNGFIKWIGDWQEVEI